MSEENKRILIEFFSKPENAEITKLIQKGQLNNATDEMTIRNGNNILTFKMEDLKNNNVDFSSLFMREVDKKDELLEQLEENDEIEEILDENIENKKNSDEIISEETEVFVENKNYTLYDLNKAVEDKNMELVDKILSSFAVNPNTGLVDVNTALTIGTSYSLNEAVNCVANNTEFSTDLSNYNVKGQVIINQNIQDIPIDKNDICAKSFENVLVYVNAARLKGIVYDEQTKQRAKEKYNEHFEKQMASRGLNTEIKEENVEVPQKVTNQPVLRPTTDIRKAGFADIFILTMILIVYAVIIINLISKLK